MRLNFFSNFDIMLKTFLVPMLLTGIALAGTAQINALPERCLICHSMKPEYYTWKASDHGQANVSCLECHSTPGIKGLLHSKLRGLKEVYNFITGSFVPPIRMVEVIPDQACERCHDANSLKKQVAYGDIIVNHNLHKYNRIQCVKCHTGLTHGKVVERKVTYASDYAKWDEVLGESMMRDSNFVKPDMDQCIRCHRLRKVNVECTNCHKKSQVPVDHGTAVFKGNGHGKLAAKNLKECHRCHRHMTENQIEGFSAGHKFEEYIGKDKARQSITPAYYSRVNKFCQDCHRKRPPGHDPKDIKVHAQTALKDKAGCFTCHDNSQKRPSKGATDTNKPLNQASASNGSVSKTTLLEASPPSSVLCWTCHPSSHSESGQWEKGFHPIPIGEKPKITRYCYYCHREADCSSCHGKSQAIKIKKEEPKNVKPNIDW